MKKKLFIHIGLHHTATTFFQKKIYPLINSKNYKYHGKIYNPYPSNTYKINESIYFLSLKKIKSDINLNFKKNLFSTESILKPILLQDNFYTLKKNLDFLKKKFTIKILVTTRKPSEIIATRLLRFNNKIDVRRINDKICSYPFCKKKFFSLAKISKFFFCKCSYQNMNLSPYIYSEKFLSEKLKDYNLKIINIFDKNNKLDTKKIGSLLNFLEVEFSDIKKIKIFLKKNKDKKLQESKIKKKFDSFYFIDRYLKKNFSNYF